MRALLLLIGFSLSIPTSAKELDLSVLGGTLFTKPEQNDSKLNGQFGLSAGLEFEFAFGDLIGVGVNALVIARRYEFGGQIPQVLYIQFTPPIRYTPLRWISVGTAPYVAYAISQSNVSIKKADYGIVGSIRFNIPLPSKLGTLVEIRVQKSLANSASSGTLEFADIMLLSGVKFNLL